MTRLGAVFWLVLVLVAGFTTFKVKYAVQDIEDELNRVRRHTIAEQQEIRVLTAEWTFLTQPERLAELNRRFLGLAPIAAKQLQRGIEDIPLRAPAAPPDEPPADPPDVLVAANPDPAVSADPAPVSPAAPVAGPAAAASLLVTPAVLASAPLGPAASIPGTARQGRPPGDAARVQLAKVRAATAPVSLDALIAQIADAR